jgi:hypothetical protein
MMFSNSKKSFQSLRAEYSLGTDLEVSRQISNKPVVLKRFQNSFERKQRNLDTLVFVKYLVVSFPLNKGMFSVLEDSLRII